MTSVIEEIKSRLNIVDIAQGYLTLEKAGGNFKARCPFHNERTPSFMISPSRQTYHCFGCNRGGDIISFVEEIEGLDFSGALKILADKAGVVLKHEQGVSRKEKDERDALFRTLELATKYYQAVLHKASGALTYLRGRGLTDETIEKFRIGYAPNEWRPLSDFALKKGVSEKLLERGGFLVRTEKGFYDRFRGRVMFPIADSSGRVIAFSGRVLDGNAGKTLGTSVSAKYLNSPETEVFHKSNVLFGFHLAKEAIRREDRAVLVEGQMDLILSHQAGVEHVVASSGTAFTKEHLALIKRFTKNIVLAFDADEAGLAAAYKAVHLALSEDMSVRIARIPHGKDPADVALSDPMLWREIIDKAEPVIDFYLALLPLRHIDPQELRTKVSEIIIPFIAELGSVLDQGHYVGLVAKLLKLKDEPVWDEVKKYKAAHAAGNPTVPRLETPVVAHARSERIARTLEGLILWQKGRQDSGDDVAHAEEALSSLMATAGISASPPERHSELIFEAEMRFQGTEGAQQEIERLLKILKEECLRTQFVTLMESLKQAEARGDTEESKRLLSECQKISHALHAITNKPQ